MEQEINEDNALSVLIDILDDTGLWQKDPNVKLCCKYIGSKIINLETKMQAAIDILSQ